MITLLQRVQSVVLNRSVNFLKTLSEAKLNLVMVLGGRLGDGKNHNQDVLKTEDDSRWLKKEQWQNLLA